MDLDFLDDCLSAGPRETIALIEPETLEGTVFQSVCALANQCGGEILIGVSATGEVLGLAPTDVEAIVGWIQRGLRNPKTIKPTFNLTPRVVVREGRYLISLTVPESDEPCQVNGHFWLRTVDGNRDITTDSYRLLHLYGRKSHCRAEDWVYPHCGLQALDEGTLNRARALAKRQGGDVAKTWGESDSEALLRRLGLFALDPETQKAGLTLGGLLLFGKTSALLSVLSQHRTDARLHVRSDACYDDRDLITDNLIASYDRLFAFGRKHLLDYVVLDGGERVSVRDRILREVITNTLVHRDFTSQYAASFCIYSNRIEVINPSLSQRDGLLNPRCYSPYAKNPRIATVFRELGLMDELGSGFKTLVHYSRLWSKAPPCLEEGVLFRTTIPVGNRERASSFSFEGDRESALQTLERLIRHNAHISRATLAVNLGVSEKTISRWVRASSRICYEGRGKNGRWVLSG